MERISLSSVIGQALVLGAILYGLYWLLTTTQANLDARGIVSGFGFLKQEAGLPIGDSLIAYDPSKSYGYAFLVGILNTLFVSALAVLFSTILGVIVGVARISGNWLVNRIAVVYVELFRNVPLLLTLFFIYTVVINTLPGARSPISPVDGVYFSKRGFYFPKPIPLDGFDIVVWLSVLAIASTIAFAYFAKRFHDNTGKNLPVLTISLAILFGIPILTFLIQGMPLQFEHAVLKGFNFAGGISLKPEFTALLLGLTLYTAAYIGENVRGGLQSVAAGQIEAANALGVSRGVVVRKILLPQALRVIIPATTNDYASLVKNSSLAVAIGFPDMVSIGGTVIGQNGQAIEVIALWMAVYMTINISISGLMNWANTRSKIVER